MNKTNKLAKWSQRQGNKEDCQGPGEWREEEKGGKKGKGQINKQVEVTHRHAQHVGA